MHEFFHSLFSRENITLILSILGALGSVSAWIYTFVKSRKRFDVKINGYNRDPHHVLLHIQFTNNSTLPLSITDISIYCNKEYHAKRIPEKVLEKTLRVGKEVRSHNEFYSISFPINLPSLAGEAGYVLFSSLEETFPQLSNDVTLIIRTNRGREVRRTLSLGNRLSQ